MTDDKPFTHTLKNLDRLEDEIGRDGVEKLSELWRKRSYELEAQMTAAWYAATGELPEGEADHLIRKHVRTVERESRNLEQELRSATITERAGAVSRIDLLRWRRGYSETQSAKGKKGAEKRHSASEAQQELSRIIKTLAAKTDGLDDPLPPAELWPELYAEMDRRGLAPDEKGGAYIYGDGQEVTYSAFRRRIQRARE